MPGLSLDLMSPMLLLMLGYTHSFFLSFWFCAFECAGVSIDSVVYNGLNAA